MQLIRNGSQDSQDRRSSVVSWVAFLLIAIAYVLARSPAVGVEERQQLAAGFRFSQHPIEVGSVAAEQQLATREVHPSLERIQSWVSATGAAVTLADLDRDGLYNDLLLVDPRLNTVLIQPLPETGDRYLPFTLEPSGLTFSPRRMSPTGSLVGDFNEDGLDDILVHYWGRTPVIFLRQPQPDPSWQLTPSAADYLPFELIAPGDEGPARWFTHAATLADVDGDGHLDLLLGNFFQDGADILNAEAAGVATVMHAGKSNARNGGGAKLFLWTPPEQRPSPREIFRDRSETIDAYAGEGWVLAIGAVDLDPGATQWPGLPEIYVANDFGPDRLLHNRSTPGNPKFVLCEGQRGFTTPKSFVLGRDSFKGMGLDFADTNGDGLMDMYVSNIADDFALHEGHFVFVSTGETELFQQGIAPYRQRSSALGLVRGGWGWDCRFADFSNDGVLEAIQATGFVKGSINRWPELHALGTTNDRLISNPGFWPKFQSPSADLSGHNPNPFYVRSPSGRYADISADLGMDVPWNTRGLAIADVDGDGWLDFLAANQWEPSVFFRNESGQALRSTSNTFIGLHLILPPESSPLRKLRSRQGHPSADTPGRPAIGAFATVRLANGESRVSHIDGGSGHSGKRAPTIHFGLGSQPPAEVSVTLNWRDRFGYLQEEIIHLEPSRWHTVELGERAER